MSGKFAPDPQRMAEVIRLSISDRNVLDSLSEQDIRVVSRHAMELLASSDVRSFIYSCFTNDEENKGLVMVDEIIAFAETAFETVGQEKVVEIVEAAVGTLSILSESKPVLKKKVFAILEHDNPSIVAAAVDNLGHSTNLEYFRRVCDLLVSEEPEIYYSAAKYVEACTRDAAFRKRPDMFAIEDAAEDFLRKALVPLEKAYKKLREDERRQTYTPRRIALLVAMIYNEILDSTDWKRINDEQVEERIYYTLEQHLSDSIGPDAIHSIFKLVQRNDIENGIKLSALKTLGRISKKERYRTDIVSWLANYFELEQSLDLLDVARSIRDACVHGNTYSSIPPAAKPSATPSIVPRAVGAPPKIDK